MKLFLDWSLAQWWTNDGLGKASHEEQKYRNNLSGILLGVKDVFKIL
jgi:hypothetical protein